MPFPPLSPIAFEIGPLVVRWYALGYLAGVFGGAWYAATLPTKVVAPTLTAKQIEYARLMGKDLARSSGRSEPLHQ